MEIVLAFFLLMLTTQGITVHAKDVNVTPSPQPRGETEPPTNGTISTTAGTESITADVGTESTTAAFFLLMLTTRGITEHAKDPVFGFTQHFYYVPENAGLARGAVTITNNVPPKFSCTVRVTDTAGGNATGGADYTRVSEDLTFVANSATNTKMEFTFPIIDDNLHEGNESVVLKGLSLCNNETFAGKATVIIIDDDDQPLPISNLTVDPKSATAMNISWTYNQAYQNVLTRIEIFDCRGPLVKNTTVPAKVSFIYVDQNLKKFIPYKVSVKPTTGLGSDQPLTKIVFTEEGKPQTSLKNIMVDRISPTKMVVSWVPLTLVEAQGFVSSYTVFYSPNTIRSKRQTSDTRMVTVPGNATQTTINNLEDGVDYDVSVLLNTTAGSGPLSTPITSATGQPTTGTELITEGTNTESRTTEAGTDAISGGGVAGIIIAIIIILAAVITISVVFVILVLKKQRKVEQAEGLATFPNDDEDDAVSLTPSQSAKEKASAQLQEGDVSFSNPAYKTTPQAGNTDEEPHYKSVGKKVLPIYTDEAAPIPQKSENKTIDEPHVQEEEKEYLGALEKQKKMKRSEPAEDSPKHANFQEYQRMDDI